jgi:hypothetical protein
VTQTPSDDKAAVAAPGLPAWFSGALLLFALALRLPMLPGRRIVEGDGVHYATLARAILGGDWSGLANPYWSNLWPGVIAATAWLTGLDVVMAGRTASLLAGSVLAPATAALASHTMGRRTGMLAGLLVAIHPWLIHFSTLVFTESFFALLLIMLLLSAVRRQDGSGVGATGVWAGLALVTRPEASAAIAAIILGFLRRGRTVGYRAILPVASLFATIAFAFLLARALLVHQYFGSWDFGGTKGTANLFVGLARTDLERERVTTEITPAGDNALAKVTAETNLIGFASENPGLVARHIRANLGEFAASSFRVLPFVPLVGGRPALWAGGWPPIMAAGAVGLCTIGLVGLGLSLASPYPPMLLIMTPFLYAAGLTLFNVHDRLLVPLIPFFLVFLAHSLAQAAERTSPEGAGVRWGIAVVAGLLGISSVLGLQRAPALDYSVDPVVQRTAGQWLAARYPQNITFMTSASGVGFYFHDAAHSELEVLIPWAGYARVIEVARKEGVGLIVAPEWHLRAAHHPAAEELLGPEGSHPGLRLVADLGEEGSRVFIYELQPLPSRP